MKEKAKENICVKIKKMMAIVIVFLSPFLANAQEKGDSLLPKTVRIDRTTALAIGMTNRLDTYLSPQDYKGSTERFLSNVLRSRRNMWDLQFSHEGAVDITHNKADNADALSGHYDFAFAMMKRWEMLDGAMTLRAGGMTNLYLGFAYNTKNVANNPAQGYASWSIGCAGSATYRVKVGRHIVPLTYEVRMPLVGIMFSPAYGQSYYELFYGGKYDDNIVFTNVSTPSLRHQFSVDLPLWRKASLRIGYLGDVRQAKPNHLKQHEYSHSFVLGVTRAL